MKHLIVFLLFLSTTILTAQNTFNTIIVSDTANLLAMTTEVVEDNYYTIGIGTGESGYKFIFLQKKDDLGNELWTRILDMSMQIGTISTGNMFISITDNAFVAMYSVKNPNNGLERNIKLVKCDLEGNLLWQQVYGSTINEGALQIIRTSEGGFFIAGFRNPNDLQNPGGMYGIKLDADGAELWDFLHFPTNSTHTSSLSVVETTDGGFILGGYINTGNYDAYLVKIDSIGNFVWDKQMGTPYDDSGVYMKTMSNGRYRITGSRNPNNQVEIYTMILNEDGDILEEMVYDFLPDGYRYIQNFYIFPDESFISVGAYDNENFKWEGAIIRYAANGDTLWTRHLTPDPYNDVYLRDVKPTPDGGFVITGFKFTNAPQYGWVFKIDSFGNTCEEIGCSIVGVEEVVEAMTNDYYTPAFVLAPNPAYNQTQIQFTKTVEQEAIVQIFNNTGQHLEEVVVPQGTDNLMYDTSKLPTGVYWCKIQRSGRLVGSQKLVVLH